ncbi:MAG: hypothetical protein JNL11_11225 [Bdellovibrionaceae bacterium]|nr:hypothetical protein [Pseudobdellovibrionaceae bacterium]
MNISGSVLNTFISVLLLTFTSCTSKDRKEETDKLISDAIPIVATKPAPKKINKSTLKLEAKLDTKLDAKLDTKADMPRQQTNYFIEGKSTTASAFEAFKLANLKTVLNRKQTAIKFNREREVIGELNIDQYQDAKGVIYYLRHLTMAANTKSPEKVDWKIDRNQASEPDTVIYEIEDESVSKETYEAFRRDNFHEDAGLFPVGEEPENEKNEDPNEEYIISTDVQLLRFANKDDDFFEEIIRTEIKGQGYPVSSKYSIKRLR